MTIKVFEGLNYEKELNPQQFSIIKEGEGPCLVLAGAGSGKTRVLVYRVCWLIENGISPSSILLVTFTNKAAKEMISRVESLLGSYPRGLWAGTFHHIGNKMLRTYGTVLSVEPNYTILDEQDSISILKEIVGKPSEDELPAPGKIKQILSLSVNTLESIKDVVNTRFPKLSNLISRFEAINKEYQKRKKKQNLVDYDDLLIFWYKLLKNEGVGTKISEKFRYVLVDEYHDTNKLQSVILYQLAKIHRNIMVVGDDAQSIYSFRGATVNNIMEFPRIYPDARTFYLDVNYRSTPQILEFANKSISHNRVRFPKNLKSIRNTGVKPVLVRCYCPEDEADFVSQRIVQLISSGIEPLDIGVLFRSRYQSAELEMELNKLKIPYIVRGGLRFFEQAHIKDVVAFFRILENFSDEIAWKRIFALTEGIGSKTEGQLLRYIADSGSFTEFCDSIGSIDLNAKAIRNLKTVLQILKKIKEMNNVPSGINLIMDTLYTGYIEKKYKDDKERLEDIKILKEIASAYTDLSEFISESSLQEHSRGETPFASSPVTLSTIHQAKGLEWKIVFLIGVSANHFPHPASSSDIMALEEERRIFYVGLTRAKEDIYITYYIRDFYRTFTNRRSVFLEEVPHYLFEEWNFPR
jgi:DNA helicase II / ATP-dependent DNA helicase PcrA